MILLRLRVRRIKVWRASLSPVYARCSWRLMVALISRLGGFVNNFMIGPLIQYNTIPLYTQTFSELFSRLELCGWCFTVCCHLRCYEILHNGLQTDWSENGATCHIIYDERKRRSITDRSVTKIWKTDGVKRREGGDDDISSEYSLLDFGLDSQFEPRTLSLWMGCNASFISKFFISNQSECYMY